MHNAEDKKPGNQKPEHKKKSKRKIKIRVSSVLTLFVIFLILVMLFNLYTINQLQRKLSEQAERAAFERIPASIQITKIVNSECADCFKLDSIVNSIMGNNVNVTQEETLEFDSVRGRSMVQKHSIEVVPALIVTGETNRTEKLEKSLKSVLKAKQDALVFSEPAPPYTKTDDGSIVGHVTVTHIKESTCTECTDLSQALKNLESETKMVIVEENTVWASSRVGTQLTRMYNITTLPSFVLSKDAIEYDGVKSAWSSLGSVEADGSLVFRQVHPPFYDLLTSGVKGLIAVTYITDKTCAECYNVTIHKSILSNPAGYNIKIVEEKYVDVADENGKELVEKYDITGVPTFVMTEDAKYYDSLRPVWPQVGTIEDDGMYVFRNIQIMRVAYRNLTSGKIAGP